MLMCMCVNFVLKANKWYLTATQHIYWIHLLSSQFEYSVNIITHFHQFIEHLYWCWFRCLMNWWKWVIMFTEHWIQHILWTAKDWAQSTSNQTVMLRVSSEQSFSALSYNVLAYVWEWSFNLLMQKKMKILFSVYK
jgi:hypothetical protein